jgi:hypothetical protein
LLVKRQFSPQTLTFSVIEAREAAADAPSPQKIRSASRKRCKFDKSLVFYGSFNGAFVILTGNLVHKAGRTTESAA